MRLPSCIVEHAPPPRWESTHRAYARRVSPRNRSIYGCARRLLGQSHRRRADGTLLVTRLLTTAAVELTGPATFGMHAGDGDNRLLRRFRERATNTLRKAL